MSKMKPTALPIEREERAGCSLRPFREMLYPDSTICVRIRVVRLQSADDDLHLRTRLFESDTGFEPAKYA
jgi:hypothetical protein